MKRRTRDAWRAVVFGQSRSGLPIEAYCRRERICTTSFYRWRGVFGAQSEVAERAKVARSEPPFVDLGTLMRSGERVQVRVELGAGVVIELSRG